MIRIGLYSEDRKLQSVLSSALGNGFKVLVESDEAGIQHLLRTGDVMLSSSIWTQMTIRWRSVLRARDELQRLNYIAL